ncbi:NACHT, LRR and PYD domains-containing protein 1 homolog [Ctenopharyngodon idella]|uniref:NACHT, LRR and PYD domains-containing protein 1 homolog n=1 Tax=Ctenopharyngodon idella TaxID=7959 RepID=UPI00222E2D10|nr:NACHT, LRR and PYD domains-containing protein 1 homolog [Ctenopharyngodon idella]
MADPRKNIVLSSDTDDEPTGPSGLVWKPKVKDYMSSKLEGSLAEMTSSVDPLYNPLKLVDITEPTFTLTPPSPSETGFQENVHQYKLSIIQKYESEWSFLSGEKESLSALYTEPVIIQKNENGSFNNRISFDELLELYGSMTVILQGDSGSGKSFIAQKIMLDWASDRVFWPSSGHFFVVFFLRCEELMCISEEMNLTELLSYSCSLTSDQVTQMLLQLPEDVLFIIDGFDELKLTQDIYEMSAHTHPLQKAPPEVILCGLIRGYLIPESNLLVTTRTKNTVNKLLKGRPRFSEIIFTGIMGFSASQVEGYFQKFFRKDYDCVRANGTLFTACSIPVICWIISEMVRVGANVTSGLETTTSIYVDFVSTLLEHHCQGLSQSCPNPAEESGSAGRERDAGTASLV